MPQAGRVLPGVDVAEARDAIAPGRVMAEVPGARAGTGLVRLHVGETVLELESLKDCGGWLRHESHHRLDGVESGLVGFVSARRRVDGPEPVRAAREAREQVIEASRGGVDRLVGTVCRARDRAKFPRIADDIDLIQDLWLFARRFVLGRCGGVGNGQAGRERGDTVAAVTR